MSAAPGRLQDVTMRLIRPAAPAPGPPRTPRTTVLVADAHPVLRCVVRDCLAETDDTAVVAEAETGDELLTAGLRTRPDVVLVDPELPGTDPLQAARELLDLVPGTRVVVHARCFSLVTFHRARRLGAVGYLLKGTDLVDLPRRIRELAAGGTAWTPRAIREADDEE
jgi:DNA-binding NarL/FixJ family response regulator